LVEAGETILDGDLTLAGTGSSAPAPPADDNDTSFATTAFVQTEIQDAGDDGRSLAGAATGVINADVELYTDRGTFSLPDPVTGDSGDYSFNVAIGAVITRVRCYTAGGGTETATININRRAEATPNTTGTDALSAGLVCDNTTQDTCASGCDVNTITSGTIAAGEWVNLEIDAVANTPTHLTVTVEYEYSD
jgi:hypothetical protein